MSKLEDALLFQLKAAKLPQPEREYRFHPTRKWRFDFAWPERRLACECEGATWVNGRHTRGAGYQNDCEKYNQAALTGWRVLRFTAAIIRSGMAVTTLERALAERV